MARPRKLATDEMLQIVDSFYESCGDPAKLKYSFLEEYAISLGIKVKAYDFRRNESVRSRMEELRALSGTYGAGAIAYKSLDVEALLNRNCTRQMMRDSLLELDETWRRVYERATDLSHKNEALLSALSAEKKRTETLASEKEFFEAEIKKLGHGSNSLLLENRYLKKALREYLYPAIANEILLRENVLEQVDTEVTQEAMEALADEVMPSSFSASVNQDRQALSREESLLRRMSAQIGSNGDA